VEATLTIFQDLGVEVAREGGVVRLNARAINKTALKIDLANKLRASILFIGPLLARFGKVEFPHPGGCVIGRRSIKAHIDGLLKLGFKFSFNDDLNKGVKSSSKPGDQTIFLDEPSVTATENLVLASSLIPSVTTLKNCASEPHVVDLCKMLNKMGANIKGVGNSTLVITGVKKLEGVDFTVGSDFIEFGTYAIASAITGGEIEIEGERLDEFEPVIMSLQKMGVLFEWKERSVIVRSKKLLSVNELKVNIWPGFPTDMMSAVIVLATQARGVMLCHDWMYESRMFFVDKLIMMGANITICDPHRVLVYGPSKLKGKNLESPDLRAGMALVLAALVSDGTSIINRAELIERGYEDVVGKLTELGASIKRIE
jgi:UDP-N-acetylglucosamine 1-carboxyvinyltransferase